MPDVETSRPSSILPVGAADVAKTQDTATTESTEGSTEPAEDTKKVIAGFQKALQQSQESLKEYRAKLKKYEEAEKSRELEGMDVSERLRAENQKLTEQLARVRVDSIIDRHTAGKNIPDAVVRALKAAPFDVIPGIREELGDDGSVDDFLEALEERLPDYVNPLVTSSTPTSPKKDEEIVEEKPTTRIDPERSGGGMVVKNHVYTRAEVDRIKNMGTKEYEKHRDAIFNQLRRDGGKLPE